MISNTYANKILNLICGLKDELTLPTELYLGLCSTVPNTSTGAVTGEPTADSYARIPVGGSSISPKRFGNASAGVIANQTEIQFPTCRKGDNWGTMNYFFLSASATGNAILWGEITGGVNITEETVPTFYEGELRISLDASLE